MTLSQANAVRWAHAKITRAGAFPPVAQKLIASKQRYQAVEALTGVPWFVIAVIHNRESSADFRGVLHNGENIIGTKRKTKLVPEGRGPFKTWEDAAFDALTNCGPYAARNKDWSVGGTLALLERYNGLGYSKKGRPSPYIWAGTDQYVSGKYVADGKYDPNAVDQQLGCAGLIMAMQKLDSSIEFGGAPAASTISARPTVETTPAAVAVAKPGIWSTLWSALRGKDAKVSMKIEKARPGLAANGDPALYDIQAMLSDKGYTEVGQPDGLMGGVPEGRTETAIRLFRRANGLPRSDSIDDKFTAALTAAGPRRVSQKRADADASILRENGNSQVAALDSFGLVGKILFGSGLLGGVGQSGVLDKANQTLQTAQDTLGTVTTVFTTIIGIAQWCFAHWWMFALGGGIYVVFRVATAVLNMVVMFRQGFLARADR